MSRVVALLSLSLVLSACAGRTHRYHNSVLALGSGFTAKEACTCLFVGGQEEAFCRELLRVRPDVARFDVDWDRREVSARSLGLARRVARFEGEGLGCTLVGRDGAEARDR